MKKCENSSLERLANRDESLYSILYNESERKRRRDQPWRRLATINKIAQTVGYNLPSHSEKKTIDELLEKYGEYSYLGGKRLGTYYLSTLDIDIYNRGYPEEVVKYLEKSIKILLDYLKVSSDRGRKGFHIDTLTPGVLANVQMYVSWKNSYYNIGSIQSKGKYVVGKDKNKAFVKNGKWYWKLEKDEEVENILNKFFIFLKNKQKRAKVNKKEEKTTTKLESEIVFVKKILAIVPLEKNEDCWPTKVIYHNEKSIAKQFMINTYQRKLIYSLTNSQIKLIRGRKWMFFSKKMRSF